MTEEPTTEALPPETPPPAEKPFRVETDGAEGAEPPITNVVMQAEDPEDAQRAEAARARVEERAPVRSQTQLEMEAGRRRIQEIAGQNALLKAKRNAEESGSLNTGAAAQANKDL